MIRNTPWRQARAAAGLTLVDVSARAKVAMNTASKYETGGPDCVAEGPRRRLDAVYAPLLANPGQSPSP
jgi:hypothetical protein